MEARFRASRPRRPRSVNPLAGAPDASTRRSDRSSATRLAAGGARARPTEQGSGLRAQRLGGPVTRGDRSSATRLAGEWVDGSRPTWADATGVSLKPSRKERGLPVSSPPCCGATRERQSAIRAASAEASAAKASRLARRSFSEGGPPEAAIRHPLAGAPDASTREAIEALDTESQPTRADREQGPEAQTPRHAKKPKL